MDIAADGNATLYNGSWTDSASGAAGTWTLEVEYTGVETLVWKNNAGSTFEMGNGGGGLHLDWSNSSVQEVNVIAFDFNMVATTAGASIDILTYAIGPVTSGFSGHPDFANATINTGGVVTADTDGGQSPGYNPLTGYLDITPPNGSSSNHDWYIDFAGASSLSFLGNVDSRDSHLIGISTSLVSPAPEPHTIALLGIGAIACLVRHQR